MLKIVMLMLLIFASHTIEASILDVLASNTLPAGIPDQSVESGNCMTTSERNSLSALLTASTLNYNNTNIRAEQVPYCEDKNFIHPRNVHYIEGKSRYVSNGTGSVYDCLKYRQGVAKAAILNQYKKELISFGDNLTSINDYKCFFSLYKYMAEESAFENGDNTAQTRYIRLWSVGSIGALFIKNYNALSSYGFFNSRAHGLALVRSWFNRLGDMVYDDSKSVRAEKGAGYMPTNIQISRSFALLNSAVISGSSKNLPESKSIFMEAIKHVSDEDYAIYQNPSKSMGFLLVELSRDTRAQSYHSISLATLLSIRSISRATNCDFKVYKNGANIVRDRLSYLFRKTAQGQRSPNVFKNQITDLITAVDAGNSSLEYFRFNRSSSHVQVGIENVDSLVALLPGTSVGSSDTYIKNNVNQFLTSKGLSTLSSTASQGETFRIKLGGEFSTFPGYHAIYDQAQQILNDGDSSNDFKALIGTNFCN